MANEFAGPQDEKKLMSDSPPILFVGAPRSGTTVIFEHFSLHPDLAWVSNYSKLFPRLASVNLIRRLFDNSLINVRGQKNQFNDVSIINKLLPRPDESYPFWNAFACKGFDRAFLLDRTATPTERSQLRRALSAVLKYQARAHVTAKLTGPGRIKYLNSVWPDVQVVHVIRDGFDVIKSLLNEDFWKDQNGYDTPWWEGGLDPDELKKWEASGKDPAELAALQWRTIIETTRSEARECMGDRYIELKYEDFLADSVGEIQKIYSRFGLDNAKATPKLLEKRNKSHQNTWTPEEVKRLQRWMSPAYEDLGYLRTESCTAA